MASPDERDPNYCFIHKEIEPHEPPPPPPPPEEGKK